MLIVSKTIEYYFRFYNLYRIASSYSRLFFFHGSMVASVEATTTEMPSKPLCNSNDIIDIVICYRSVENQKTVTILVWPINHVALKSFPIYSTGIQANFRQMQINFNQFSTIILFLVSTLAACPAPHSTSLIHFFVIVTITGKMNVSDDRDNVRGGGWSSDVRETFFSVS